MPLPMGTRLGPYEMLRLLKRLDQPVEQDAIETSIAEANVTLMMLVEGVHGILQCGQIPGSLPHQRPLRVITQRSILKGYQGEALAS